MPKISQEPAGTAPDDTVTFVIVQNGVTVRLTGAQVIGGTMRTVRIVTASGAITVVTTDQDILVAKTVAAATTINLPAAATFASRDLFIKDMNGVCNTFNFTVTPFAGENIDGLTTYPMLDNYAHLWLVKKTSGWYVRSAL